MKKTKIFAILAISLSVLFIVSCKKDQLTPANTPTSLESTNLEKSVSVQQQPQYIFPASITANSINTYYYTGKNKAGKLFNYSITVTKVGNNLLYDIDGDGVMDYQAIPRMNGKVVDNTNFKIYDGKNNVLRSVNLTTTKGSLKISEANPSFVTDSPIKFASLKSMGGWLSCMRDNLDLGVTVTLAITSPGAAGVYVGLVGIRCCFGLRDGIQSNTYYCLNTGTTTTGGSIDPSGTIYNPNGQIYRDSRQY